MKFGIMGAGPIGSNISKKLVENGHDVKVADVRNIQRLEGKDFAGKAVEVGDVTTDIDVLIISLPLHVIPDIRGIVNNAEEDVIIIDTSNYYPFRDGEITELEQGKVESVWVSEQLGLPIIKAFSNMLAHTLESKGKPEGAEDRIAMTVAGDDLSQKNIVMDLVDELGFDPVDSGSLEESWRQQPGTPAYCTELKKEELVEALEKADKEKAPSLRDKVIENFPADATHDDVIELNRKIYNS